MCVTEFFKARKPLKCNKNEILKIEVGLWNKVSGPSYFARLKGEFTLEYLIYMLRRTKLIKIFFWLPIEIKSMKGLKGEP